ncbi:MAG TPA: peptidylprolyl isomerase [Dissulfurispiraceae bacterium]|nr:peptidylprolyl isomerase [Dissulfurispiraceae bacterium]
MYRTFFHGESDGLERLRLFAAICALVLGIFLPAEGAILLDRVMAIVNKDVITWSEVYKNMEFEAADVVKGMSEDDRRRFFKENERAFLEKMIDLKLVLQEASKIGISAGDEDVRKAIEGIKKKYGMNDEQFAESIAREGFTVEDYKKKLAEQITTGRIVEQEVRSKVLVSEKDIDAYLEEHPDLQSQSEGFSLSRIFLRKADERSKVDEKALDIYSRIKSGEDFGLLARQYSEDATAKSGGDCGFLKKAEVSPEFLSVLSTMKPGEVSEPFWTATGVYIVRLDAVQEFKGPQELRESVRQRLTQEGFEKEYKNWVKGLRERAYVDIKT